jgi:5'-deoxynucleotidase YfbR-like HD superfamily hydrolase
MTPTDIIRAANVMRWHTTPEVRPESLGAHQWAVTVLMLHYWPETTKDAMEEALHHDTHELLTGDMPWHTKRRFPGLAGAMYFAEMGARDTLGIADKNTTSEERRRIKFCDRLQAYRHVEAFTPELLVEDDWLEAWAWIIAEADALGVVL